MSVVDFKKEIKQNEVVIIDGQEILLKAGYDPVKDEDYMGKKHLAYFKKVLDEWKAELAKELQVTIHHLQNNSESASADFVDRVTSEADTLLELRTRDRITKLLKKIDKAIMRIELRTYGYCEETGEEIGVNRLLARPVAHLCIKAQEQHEDMERKLEEHLEYSSFVNENKE